MTEAQQKPERQPGKRTERNAMPGSKPTVADLRHDVELTREELADTVSELAAKLDVKTRTSKSMQRYAASAQRHPRMVAAVALGLVVALIAVKRMRNR